MASTIRHPGCASQHFHLSTSLQLGTTLPSDDSEKQPQGHCGRFDGKLTASKSDVKSTAYRAFRSNCRMNFANGPRPSRRSGNSRWQMIPVDTNILLPAVVPAIGGPRLPSSNRAPPTSPQSIKRTSGISASSASGFRWLTESPVLPCDHGRDRIRGRGGSFNPRPTCGGDSRRFPQCPQIAKAGGMPAFRDRLEACPTEWATGDGHCCEELIHRGVRAKRKK